MDRGELRLSFRCDKRWEELDGDGATRHCTQCDHDVVDLSSHSALGARLRLLLHRGKEPPCVRYEVRNDQVHFRRGRLLRAAAALLAMVPLATPARAGEMDDADPVPGEVHLCSSDGYAIMGRIARRPRPFRWLRPHGTAALHVAADVTDFRRLAVTCEGSPLPKRARLRDGEVFFHDLPTGRSCTVRLKGKGRPLSVRFVAGSSRTQVEVADAE